MAGYEQALIQAGGEYLHKIGDVTSAEKRKSLDTRQNFISMPTSENLEKQILKLDYSTPKNENKNKNSSMNLAKFSIKELSEPGPGEKPVD